MGRPCLSVNTRLKVELSLRAFICALNHFTTLFFLSSLINRCHTQSLSLSSSTIWRISLYSFRACSLFYKCNRSPSPIDNQVWLSTVDPLFLLEWSFTIFMRKEWKRRNPNSQRLLPPIASDINEANALIEELWEQLGHYEDKLKPVALTLQNHRLRMAPKSGLSEKSSKLWWPQSKRIETGSLRELTTAL